MADPFFPAADPVPSGPTVVPPPPPPLHAGHNPDHVKKEKVKAGDAQIAAVAKLAADLAKPAADLGLKVDGPKTFGLELDVLDPETGLLVAAARAHRRDVGIAGHIMTVDQVVQEVTAARDHARTAGTLTPAP